MKKQLRMAMGVGVLAGSVVFSPSALAEFSANAAVTSNYVFRGESMSADHAAVQGGIDYAHDTGIYVGAWLSNVDSDHTNKVTGTEYDLYAGVANEIGAGIGYDIAYLSYNYSNKDYAKNSHEIQLGLTWGPAAINYYIGDSGESTDNKYNYLEGNLEFELPLELGLQLHYGATSGDMAKARDFNGDEEPDNDNQITDYSVGLNREFFGVKFSINYADHEYDQPKRFAMISKEFSF